MGCSGGTRSLLMFAFWAKKRTSMYIFREKGDDHFYIQTAQKSFFQEKLPQKAHVNTDASISDRAHAPLGIP